jgi:hypothetical protein
MAAYYVKIKKCFRRHFDFLAWHHWIYCILALELFNISKNETSNLDIFRKISSFILKYSAILNFQENKFHKSFIFTHK